MAVTSFSPLLGLALPTTGDLSGTWGTTVNTAITGLIDSAVAGTTTLSANSDVTLTTTSGVANEAREAVILWTASNGATTRTITVPAQSKTYVVINAGTGSIIIKGAGTVSPYNGVTITSGDKALVAWNGSDFVRVSSAPGGATTQVQFNNAGVLAGSSNLTWSGTALAITGTLSTTGSAVIGGTGAVTLPNGVDGDRPSPTYGMIRYNTSSNQFEGYSQVASTPGWYSVGGSSISNDASTASTYFPLYAKATSGTAQVIYTANTEYTFKPSTGDLTSQQFIAGNGLFVNGQTISTSYSIPSTQSAMSVGPVTIASGVTVTLLSDAGPPATSARWVIL